MIDLQPVLDRVRTDVILQVIEGLRADAVKYRQAGDHVTADGLQVDANELADYAATRPQTSPVAEK